MSHLAAGAAQDLGPLSMFQPSAALEQEQALQQQVLQHIFQGPQGRVPRQWERNLASQVVSALINEGLLDQAMDVLGKWFSPFVGRATGEVQAQVADALRNLALSAAPTEYLQRAAQTVGGVLPSGNQRIPSALTRRLVAAVQSAMQLRGGQVFDPLTGGLVPLASIAGEAGEQGLRSLLSGAGGLTPTQGIFASAAQTAGDLFESLQRAPQAGRQSAELEAYERLKRNLGETSDTNFLNFWRLYREQILQNMQRRGMDRQSAERVWSTLERIALARSGQS